MAGLTVGQWLDTFELPDDARKVALWLVRTATYPTTRTRLSADVAAGQIQLALVNNVLYLDNGWGSMVDVAGRDGPPQRRRDPDGRHRHVASRRIPADGDLTVTLSAGPEIRAGAVVLAAGTPAAAAALLGDRPAAWAELGPEVEASVLESG